MKFSALVKIYLIIFSLLSGSIYSQSVIQKKNFLFLELGGNNYVYSINYERIILNSASVRLGGSIIPWGESSHSYGNSVVIKIGLLTMVNYTLSLSNNFGAEIGFGCGNILRNDYTSSTATLGFKYLPYNSKLFYKISFTPIFENKFNHTSVWGGISIVFKY